MALARLSRERTWWTDYRDIMRPGNFVGPGGGAASMRTWEPIILPGLLQTEAYMRALMRTGRAVRPAAAHRPPGRAAPEAAGPAAGDESAGTVRRRRRIRGAPGGRRPGCHGRAVAGISSTPLNYRT